MNASLSYILRPKTVKDIIGQTHLLNNKNGIIYKMIEKKFTANLIFYGPPGIGKTSTAISLANDLNIAYEQFNASKDKKEKLQAIIERNKEEKVILIIDEIHRMNRNIQDFLLEYIESKEIIVYITTTENPYFVINPAIRSRCTILQLREISVEELQIGLKKIIKENEFKLEINDEVLKEMALLANGDLRVALNALELLLNLYSDQEITSEILLSIFDKAYAKGSAEGDEYHDLKSALQKSIRGSDVNAALHYWARLMEIGDFEVLMRRMIIMAYEDVGLANPAIGPRVYNACQIFRQVGMPEGRIILGLAIIEMALSEKSNSSYLAIEQALGEVRAGGMYPIPAHLRDTHYKSASKLGAGIGYKYAHDYENDWVDQQYLPDKIKNKVYFNFKPHSAYEKKLKEIYDKFTKKK
ncbi:replication-associated recombination protein A [Spiroplasma culicicola]|uniref:Recombination factor protein RarA n=1 Tax=Spiroplasma culicicola AES-1 TaxID=1276246 RepID=W6AGD7_9MOLU|nr:replication-associated recombination protein A [Spiroplasma culicicola]AHI52729.1 recombination factor protein RarA [Spiroplasma culicicola AES-1]